MIASSSNRQAATSLLVVCATALAGGAAYRQWSPHFSTGTVALTFTHQYAVSAAEGSCRKETTACASARDACGTLGWQQVNVAPQSGATCEVTCCPEAPTDETCYFSETCGACASGFLPVSGPAAIAESTAGSCDIFCCTPARRALNSNICNRPVPPPPASCLWCRGRIARLLAHDSTARARSSFWLNDCAGCPLGVYAQNNRKYTFPGGLGPRFTADRPACWNLCVPLSSPPVASAPVGSVEYANAFWTPSAETKLWITGREGSVEQHNGQEARDALYRRGNALTSQATLLPSAAQANANPTA